MNIKKYCKKFIKRPFHYMLNPLNTCISIYDILKKHWANDKNEDKLVKEAPSVPSVPPLEQRLRAIYSIDGQIKVRRGPFKGMVYPAFESSWTPIWPLLIGVYEKEIQDIIAETMKKRYKYFIDVGCAEGYYAVGYARGGGGLNTFMHLI